MGKIKYIVVGMLNGKKYVSRKKFNSYKDASKHGNKLTYNPSGNTKRKNQLYNWEIIKI